MSEYKIEYANETTIGTYITGLANPVTETVNNNHFYNSNPLPSALMALYEIPNSVYTYKNSQNKVFLGIYEKNIKSTFDSFNNDLTFGNNVISYNYSENEKAAIKAYFEAILDKSEQTIDVTSLTGILTRAAKETVYRLWTLEKSLYGDKYNTLPGDFGLDATSANPTTIGIEKIVRSLSKEIFFTDNPNNDILNAALSGHIENYSRVDFIDYHLFGETSSTDSEEITGPTHRIFLTDISSIISGLKQTSDLVNGNYANSSLLDDSENNIPFNGTNDVVNRLAQKVANLAYMIMGQDRTDATPYRLDTIRANIKTLISGFYLNDYISDDDSIVSGLAFSDTTAINNSIGKQFEALRNRLYSGITAGTYHGKSVNNSVDTTSEIEGAANYIDVLINTIGQSGYLGASNRLSGNIQYRLKNIEDSLDKVVSGLINKTTFENFANIADNNYTDGWYGSVNSRLSGILSRVSGLESYQTSSSENISGIEEWISDNFNYDTTTNFSGYVHTYFVDFEERLDAIENTGLQTVYGSFVDGSDYSKKLYNTSESPNIPIKRELEDFFDIIGDKLSSHESNILNLQNLTAVSGQNISGDFSDDNNFSSFDTIGEMFAGVISTLNTHTSDISGVSSGLTAYKTSNDSALNTIRNSLNLSISGLFSGNDLTKAKAIYGNNIDTSDYQSISGLFITTANKLSDNTSGIAANSSNIATNTGNVSTLQSGTILAIKAQLDNAVLFATSLYKTTKHYDSDTNSAINVGDIYILNSDWSPLSGAIATASGFSSTTLSGYASGIAVLQTATQTFIANIKQKPPPGP